MADTPFWRTKPLSEMNDVEWESLCDGCGKCCLVLLRDEDCDDVWETNVACRLFDAKKRQCSDYANRLSRVRGCVQLTPDNAGALDWMPDTCAYRRLARGQDLPDWHPLVTGDKTSTSAAGMAVATPLFNEDDVDPDDLEDHITKRRNG